MHLPLERRSQAEDIGASDGEPPFPLAGPSETQERFAGGGPKGLRLASLVTFPRKGGRICGARLKAVVAIERYRRSTSALFELRQPPSLTPCKLSSRLVLKYVLVWRLDRAVAVELTTPARIDEAAETVVG